MAVYTADFETTTAEISEEETRVWLYAYCNIEKWDGNHVIIGFTIEDFINDLEHYFKSGDSIWFHNLKFDGNFILCELLKQGYHHVENVKKTGYKKCFSSLISDAGTWYQITVKYYSKTITIKNSACLLSMSVKAIGESFKTKKRKQDMDYNEAHLNWWEVTEEDKEYIRADVQIMAEVMNILINEFGLEKLTAGANAMNDYIDRLGGNKVFRQWFPKIGKDIDEFLRPGYKGGWCYMKPRSNPRCTEQGTTYDVNSLYPSVMHSNSGNYYPYGLPEYYEGKYVYDENYPLWVARVKISFSIKDKKFPCIQIKKSFMYNEHEWQEEIDEPVELVITSVDWELIKECYNIDSIQWIDGYKFRSVLGPFDKFINYWYEIKKTSKGAKKQLAKLMLNSFYGKFATRLTGCSRLPYLDEDGVLHFKASEEEEHTAYYLPVGMFVTAYARKFTITAANDNFDRFCYADTDSIHILGWEPAKGITIDKNELLCWKDESYWDDAVFVRQKTYMEHGSEEKDAEKEWSIRCAGMPDNLRYGYYYDDKGRRIRDKNGDPIKFVNIKPEDFKIGLSFEKGKLKQKSVKGGVLLIDGPFQIRDPHNGK